MTEIGDSAFSSCSQLTSINIPDGVTSIPYGCFSGCSSLTELKLPAGVTEIGAYVFSGCSQLTSINIPEGVTVITGRSFEGCRSLTELKLPAGVTKIGNNAFSSCSQLTTINIPEGVTSIPDQCFYGCSSLTELVLPSGVTKIGSGTFSGCSQLTELTCLNPLPPAPSSSFSFSPYLETVYVPVGAKTAYEQAKVWMKYNIVELGTLKGTLEIDDFEINAGQTKTVNVSFKGELNDNTYSGFQFAINLPEGISVSSVALNESLAADGFTISTKNTDTSVIGVVSANTKGNVTSLAEGIVTLTVTAAADAPDGVSELTISKIYLSDTRGSDMPLADSETDITIHNVPVTGFTFEPEGEQSIYVDQNVTITATPVPSNATNQGFTWSIEDNDSEIQEVSNENGVITVKGLKLGEATLRVTAEDYKAYTATVKITVVPTPAQSVEVSSKNLEMLPGTTQTLTATVKPDDTTYKTITWSSESTDIATVTADGLVTAVKAGQTTITAKCGDVEGTCTVIVKALGSITVTPGDGSSEGEETENPGQNTEDGMAVVGNDLILRVNQTGTITLTIEPGIDYDPELEWNLTTGGNELVQMTVKSDDSTTATFKGLAVGTTAYTVSTPADGAEILKGNITVIAENPVMSLTL